MRILGQAISHNSKKVGEPVKICIVEGCGKQATRKNMCHKHYFRIYRNGDLEIRKRPPKPVKYCDIEDCNNKHYSGGLCAKHYRKRRREQGKDLNSSYKQKNYKGKGRKEKSKELAITVNQLREQRKTFKEIGQILGLSKQRIHQIYHNSRRSGNPEI